MEILIKAIQLLLSLSILILLHEMGHFLIARLFKVRVEKFYLFFDPWFSLFKYKKGDTEYGIGWLPLGGYVKISGMIDESFDKEQLKQEPQPWEFRVKPAWQRLLIMLGGVIVNFLLALIIFSAVLYAWGDDYLPTKNAKYGIAVDSLAYNVGLRSGDKILSVDGKEIENFSEIVPSMLLNSSKTIEVQRDTQKLSFKIPESTLNALIQKQSFFTIRFPFIISDFAKDSEAKKAGFLIGDKMLAINGEEAMFVDQFKTILSKHKKDSVTVSLLRANDTLKIKVLVPESGLIGIAAKLELNDFFETKHVDYSFFEAIPAGIAKGFASLTKYVKQFKYIFNSEAKGYEQVGGFMAMGSYFPGTWDWQFFWNFTAFLSIVLAFMNVLPIPALDGGHVMFLLYEMITGRKPSDKFLEYATMVGIILVFALILYANGNDIYRYIFK